MKITKNRSICEETGFTLVELLVVIAIISIIAAVAFPALNRTRATMGLSSATTDFIAVVKHAKFEAIKTKTPTAIAIGVTINGVYYDYVTYFDTDGDLAYDANERTLNEVYVSKYTGSVVLWSSTFAGTPIGFDARGLPRGALGGTTIFRNKYGEEKQVRVNGVGNVRVAQ